MPLIIFTSFWKSYHTANLTDFILYLLNGKNNFLDFLIVRILSQVFNRTKVNIIAQMTIISKPSKSSKFK